MPSDLALFGGIIGGGAVAVFFAAYMTSEEDTLFDWLRTFFQQDAKASRQARKQKRTQQFERFLKEKQRMNREMDGAVPAGEAADEPKKER